MGKFEKTEVDVKILTYLVFIGLIESVSFEKFENYFKTATTCYENAALTGLG